MARRRETYDYPSSESAVDVTFIDGEVKTYFITAGIGIGQYLAGQAAETGVLVLFNNSVSHGIPMNQIREYVIRNLREGESLS